MEHKKLQIIYKDDKPHGIRDENGFLLFFCTVQKYQGQETRYKTEIYEQFELAESLINFLNWRK